MSNVIDTLASLARKIEYSDTRLACRVDPDEHKCQIYLTSSSRPDVPEGIALLHLYYQIRILKNNLCKNDVEDLIKDASSFANWSLGGAL